MGWVAPSFRNPGPVTPLPWSMLVQPCPGDLAHRVAGPRLSIRPPPCSAAAPAPFPPLCLLKAAAPPRHPGARPQRPPLLELEGASDGRYPIQRTGGNGGQRPADRHAAGEQLGEIRAQDRGPSILWCVWGGRGGVSGACGPAGFRTTWEMFNVPESEAHPRRRDQNWGWGWGGACF